MPELPLSVWIALAAVLGLLVGSFLNVVILRLPERMAASWRREAREVLEMQADDAPLPPGIVRQPSHCPHCVATPSSNWMSSKLMPARA